MLKCIVIVLVAGLTVRGSLNAQVTQIPSTNVPVRSVLLFSSGVGYFEHAGTVRGNAATELRFRTAQINDILKSLVLQDEDGGRVGAITYPSQEPVARTLRSFQVDITENPSLAELLNQLRGAQVTIQSQAERLTGTILGVERRRVPSERGEPVETAVLNLLTGATIRAIELQSITSLTLDNPQLQDELTRALSALSQARDQDKKPVTIDFAGTGDRRVRIGYVVETPVWKTSYRLLLDDQGDKLHGWAIVENQTESDWENVSLSLVSGRPLSFVMDLYQPLYAVRPVVTQQLFAGLRPPLHDAGIAEARERVGFPTAAPAPPAQGQLQGKTSSLMDQLRRNEALALNAVVTGGVANPTEMAESIQAIATAATMGELFHYTIGNVTLPRQKSAMLPIITDSIGVERVSIYNASVLSRHPLNGVRLRNTTGKHLLQGPITVLDENSYAGDARIDNVPPGQDRLVSYGVDLQMLVDNTKNTQTSSVVTGRINKGVLTIDRRHVAVQEYLADNKGERDRTIVIEHPIKQGWKLADTAKPVETTQSLYRFQGTAAAGKITTLNVREEIVRSETIALLGADPGQLLTYSRTGEIPAPVREALVRAMTLKGEVVATEREMADRTRRITEITQEQTRIRENMKTVSQTAQYYQRLLAKLNEQESSIETLQRERDALTVRRDTQRKALEDYLAVLTVG